jgi:hypothetical protein
MRRSRRKLVAASIGVGFLLLVGAALATPGVGIIMGPVHARGTLDKKLDVKSDAGIKLKSKRTMDFVTQQIVIGGGGSTGWHSHPGPVLVTVKTGALRLIYADDRNCDGTVYVAGDSFVDRGDATVHIARNESLLDNVELWATYLVPGTPGTTAFRIDAPDPGPPDSCNPKKNGGDDD